MKNPDRAIVRSSASRTTIPPTRSPRRASGRNSGSDGCAFDRGGLDIKAGRLKRNGLLLHLEW